MNIMNARQVAMIEAFAEEERRRRVDMENHSTVGVPLGTRLQRIIRLPDGWRLWLSTNDFKLGTYLELANNGKIVRVTVRGDEGDEIMLVRPSDDKITKEDKK